MNRPLLLALALTLSASGAWADRYSDCSQPADADRQVRGNPSKEDGMPQSVRETVRTHLDHGRACFDKGEIDRAIADYDKAIALNPNIATAYANRGLAYRKKGEVDRAIALDPEDAAAYFNRGLAHESKGEVDRAIADYSKAIEVNPKYAKAYSNRGIAYEKKGDKEQAIADYREALEFANTNQFAKQGLKRLGVTP
jgi:tetratricopeptide (TPR) repeat protein